MPQTTCAYLDLLGFSNYTAQDVKDALRLISNYQTILSFHMTVRESFDSVDSFLPFSDSIFILSNDSNKFIKQLSRYLVDCFMMTSEFYTYPPDPNEPTKVIIKNIGYDPIKKEIIKKDINQNWYPLIFKGGITNGEVIWFKQSSIRDKKIEGTDNIAGKAVVKSVLLEKSGKGPRLFCDVDFERLLDETNNRRYILKTRSNIEILWPIEIFDEEFIINSDHEFEIDFYNSFLRIFTPAYHLWKSIENKSISNIYYNLLKLIVLSACRHYSFKGYEKNCFESIKKHLETINIGNLYYDLIDGASFVEN